MIRRILKIVTKYLLRKGTGILRIHVFVARQTTPLRLIVPEECCVSRVVDGFVLNDISNVRGKKKGARLKTIREKGAYGMSYYYGNELAAYGWIGINRESTGKRVFSPFIIPSGSAHIFDCYTVEKFRGRNLYPAIVQNLTEWARQQGIEEVYIDVVSDNTGAMKGIGKLGFEPVSVQVKVMFLNKILVEYDRKR